MNVCGAYARGEKRKRGNRMEGKRDNRISIRQLFPNCDVILPITSHSTFLGAHSGSAVQTEDHIADKASNGSHNQPNCDPSVIRRRSTLFNLVLGRGVGLPSASQLMARRRSKLPSKPSRPCPLDSASHATPRSCPS